MDVQYFFTTVLFFSIRRFLFSSRLSGVYLNIYFLSDATKQQATVAVNIILLCLEDVACLPPHTETVCVELLVI